MTERGRRLRVRSTQPDLRGSRETLPGPTTWVRPATGWWGRMNAGRKTFGIKGVPYGRPCPFPEGGLETEGKRRSGAPRGAPVRVTDRQFPPAGGTGSIARSGHGVRRSAPAPFGAPLPHVCAGASPREPRGWKCPALPAPCENRGGGALAFVRRLFEM